MTKRKFINLILLLVFLFSFVGESISTTLAKTTNPPVKIIPDKPVKVTQADRDAAAARAAADGFTLEAVGAADMAMAGDAPHYFSHPNYANSPLPGNVVAEWNAFAQELLQPSGMSMTMSGGISMSKSFVILAYMQAAVYDALIAIEGGYQPYNAGILAFANTAASREAAVAEAAYRTLVFGLQGEPNYATDIKPVLDATYANALAAIPASTAKEAGKYVGLKAAEGIIALRTGDVLTGSGGYVVPPPGPGVWEPIVMTAPDGTLVAVPPMDPWMRNLKPFLRATPDQYTATYAALEPDLTDDPATTGIVEYMQNNPEYILDFKEVRDYGGASSALRTPDQTETAQFWTTNMVIQANVSYRNVAETRGLNLLDTARLMAMGNMIASDSLIATFSVKYEESFWRPYTAIQHTISNDLTNVYTYSATTVNTWMPAFPTPNFPEFVAGHGSFVSSQAELFTYLFGPQINIDLLSTATGTTRTYATAADMRNEVVDARTWGGMHFRTSTELAVTLGQQLVQDALAGTYFDPAASTAPHAEVSGGIRKFVDSLAQLCDPSVSVCTGTSTLGQFLPVAVADTTTYPGADYYEIALVQYREKMHTDLPPTLLRGYVQIWTSNLTVKGAPVALSNELLNGTTAPALIKGVQALGVTKPHYLGPTIVATKDRPVRIKFYNLLPTTANGGNLFLPVDVTVMGSGMAPLAATLPVMDTNPQMPMCDVADPIMKAQMVADGYCYAENRATLHLHGGITPWISDGTPHQWITPANENTPYPQGVSVVAVPDMAPELDTPTDGAMTFYYTNQQSARLMFYHDHAYGITRLNVYAGEAAPYIITDDAEKSLVSKGLIPGAANTIPLVIQDKTFVPSAVQLAVSDETWDMDRWGGTGNLWLPHVYSPAQNPGDSSGVNQFGRWAYGPWFWPPTTAIEFGPVTNPYYVASCDPNVTWCEPPLMPGTPFNSMGMEAFMDTPVVNGTVYPTLTVKPETYRFRILNAANDRFFNLSFYKAVDANGLPCDLANLAPAPSLSGVTCTEVALNPDEVAAALADPTVFPTPLVGTEGPDWIAIGTEGGFLPAPAVIPAQPTTWVNDPTVFNAGNVDLHSLLVGPAERHDVIVDFSQFVGQTLILYNDAPAAFPARDPRYDYYTGNGDYRDTGGASATLPGYGPNTRTVMQIKVVGTQGVRFDDPLNTTTDGLAKLETAFAHNATSTGVFESSQHPIIVGQGAYNSAYGKNFQDNGDLAGLVQIFDTSFTFQTLLGATLTMPLQPKQIQDEMGEAFDPEYGRMSGFLGLETPNASAGLQNMLLYPFPMPPTEVLRGIELPLGVELTPIASADDGSQIWKITHNGVDTHPIHFHLYDVQLINRVGWDGIIRKPEANELGWKDTVRISPLEDTIVALRPLVPSIPWDLPNSVRLLDPTMPEGVLLSNPNVPLFDPSGEPVEVYNHFINYGWEYVWHCHILSHEEMDMMRPMVVGVTPKAPTALAYVDAGNGNNRTITLSWADNSLNETSFTVQIAPTTAGPWANLAVLSANTTSYIHAIGNDKSAYAYRVFATNTVGDTFVYPAPSVGFPTEDMVSAFTNTVVLPGAAIDLPIAPNNLTAVFQNGPQVLLTWNDNATNETGFLIQRSTDGGLTFTDLVTVGARTNTGSVSYTDVTVKPATTYTYQVAAVNAAGTSAFSNLATVSIPALPAAPSPLLATATRQNAKTASVTLNWTNVLNENGYTIQRSTDPTFNTNVTVTTLGADLSVYTIGKLSRYTPYYFRIRSFNGAGVSAWVNATPFPIITP